MLLGIPGDNTFSNYQEANRTFWRSTVLPLAQRIVGALNGWLTPVYPGTLCLDIDVDDIPALSSETDTLWTRLNTATFLTADEKRTAAGYGPAALDQKFSPGQPRAPSGRPNGGQWTKPGGDSGGGNPEDGGPTPDPFGDGVWDLPPDALPPSDTPSGGPDEIVDPPTSDINDPEAEVTPVAGGRRQGPSTATPAQEARLSVATSNAQEAVSRLQNIDPTWRGPEGASSTIEGQIAHQDSMARAANERYTEIQNSRFGDNGGPPLRAEPGGSTAPPRFSMEQAPYAIDAYRNNWRLPDGQGTVAIGTMDGKPVFGVNSTAPGYTLEDRAAADAMRGTLVDKYPFDMATDNIGQKPNDALYHAEATALMRAARESGGGLYGRNLDLLIDRPMCGSCDVVLPLLSRELGNPTVSFTDIYGRRRRLRNGIWE